MQTPCFLPATPINIEGRPHGPRARPHTPATCRRYRVSAAANINKTTDAGREDEIAAKIASLRKQKRLKNTTPPPAAANAGADANAGTGPTTPPPSTLPPPPPPPTERDAPASKGIFSQLPDWKKEEILQQQMKDAESFFAQSATPAPPPFPTPLQKDDNRDQAEGRNTAAMDDSDDNDDEDKYKPKVSTWGVFPRPDNISKAFGGGRKIQAGGIDLNSESAKKRDASVANQLSAYRSARGIDMHKEEENGEAIQNALADADAAMRTTRPYDAMNVLEAVVPFVSDRSLLGGQVLLALALAYEAVGKRDAARDLYTRLRSSAFTDISSKARQLLQGFAAMKALGINDDTTTEDAAMATGLRVADFNLPDLNDASAKRYDTLVVAGDNEPASLISSGTNIMLAVLLLAPLLAVAAFALSRHASS